mgnify:CR=1 FL=1
MSLLGRIIFFLLIIFIQWYFFQAIDTVTRFSSPLLKKITHNFYFVIVVFMILAALAAVIYPFQLWPRFIRISAGSLLLIVFLVQFLGILFLIPDDILRMFRWIYSRFLSSNEAIDAGEPISRYRFFSYLAVTFSLIPGIGLLYGFFRGGYDYRVHRVKLSFPNLPDAFDGFKIVQLSDIHTGSFANPAPLKKAFKLAMEQKPDVIFFTGDLVNDIYEETFGFESVYKILQAPHGVHSIFGNHDYAEYIYPGDENVLKRKVAQENLKKVHADAGWNLLMNQHTYLEKGGQRIGLIGVENWDSIRRFRKYGDLHKACEGMDDLTFKILLSHSPSHWNDQVREGHKDIDLTFSGHTHGMQLGIEIPGFKWSPVKYLYPQWAGLYRDGSQYLYVNRGLGFIGYNGRLGIWPEITVVELKKGKSDDKI